jgi:flagellar hook-length control protein FliK
VQGGTDASVSPSAQNTPLAQDALPFQNTPLAQDALPFQNTPLAQDALPFQNTPLAQDALPSQNTAAGVPASGSNTAPAIDNGMDSGTSDDGGRSAGFPADVASGRASGSLRVDGDSTTSSTANPTHVQFTGVRVASNASSPASAPNGQLTSASDAQPTNASNAQPGATNPQTAAAVSDSAQETSAQSVAGIGGATTQTPSFSTPADGAPLVASGVPMQEVIDAIRATVALAARQGVAQARIELQPQELGQISIRLSQTSAGLSARVSADTAAGAQALTQGGSELRQSLSSLGVSLLRLDIGSSGQSDARGQGERSSGRPGATGTSTPTTTTEEGDTLAEADGGSTPRGVARGEIVDVLA